MTVYVPTSVASVTMYDNAGLVDHTHTPGDRPDLDSAAGWAIKCSSACERAIVSGFDAWADGDARVVEGDGRVDVYGVTVQPDEPEAVEVPPEPGVPVFNITVNTPKQKRQKRPKVTVEATVAPANVTVHPQVTVAQPPAQPRRTSVRRRKDGTMIVESEPQPMTPRRSK